MASFRAHDLDYRIIVVPTRRVDRYSRWLVDDDHIIVFMDYTNGLSSDWGLVTVQCMRYDLPILDNVIY